MSVKKSYAGAAPELDLVGGIAAIDTTFVAASGGAATGWPDGSAGAFIALLGGGEKVLCASRSGTSFTVALGGRGYDGTTAAAWPSGTTVKHTLDAESQQNFSNHMFDVTRDDHTQYTHWFNVKAYGAKGDGITDDATAIKAAVDAAAATATGGVVYFPEGIYLCAHSVDSGYGISHISGSPIKFMGAGRFLTTIMIKPPANNGFRIKVDYDEICDLTIDLNTYVGVGSSYAVAANYTAARRLRVFAADHPFPIYYPGPTNIWGEFNYGNIVDDLILDDHFNGDSLSFCLQRHGRISNVLHTGCRLQVFGCSDVIVENYRHTMQAGMSLTTAQGIQVCGPGEDLQFINCELEGSPGFYFGSAGSESAHTSADLTMGNTYTSIPCLSLQIYARAGDTYQLGGPSGQTLTVSADNTDPHNLPVNSFVASQDYPTLTTVWNVDDVIRRVKIVNMLCKHVPDTEPMLIGDVDDFSAVNLTIESEAGLNMGPDNYGALGVRFVSCKIPQVQFAALQGTAVDAEFTNCRFPIFTPHAFQSARTMVDSERSGLTVRVNGGLWENTGFGLFLTGPTSTYAVRNLRGYNPRGPSVTTPAVPASTTAATNVTGSDCTVFVTGGTVSAVKIGGTSTGLTSGAFRVPAGQTISITYTVAPTWVWFGD